MIVAPLGNQARKSFSCGEPALDTWFKKQAGQDAKRGYASVFVALSDNDPETIIGFYSLSAASINLSALSQEYAKKLPRYPEIPAIRLGRFAVHKDFQRNNIGHLLLLDSIKRSCASEIAWAFFLVEAKNERARRFYEKFYFESFLDNNLIMWLTRKKAERIVSLVINDYPI